MPVETPLRIRQLSKGYGSTQVIHGLDLEIDASSIHGLVGLNGSGKTTTLDCVLGMQPFDSGQIDVLGLPPDRLYEARGAVVGIFDTPSLHPGLTVRQSLEHARLLCPDPARTCHEVEQLLGITGYRDFKIRQLSLGNKRRTSIAHALLGNPQLIILDEPFNGLDAEGVSDVLELITDLNRDHGTAFLLSSHQLPYLEQICSHLSVLHRGVIALSDRIDTLFRKDHARIQLSCHDPVAAVKLIEQSKIANIESSDGQRIVCNLVDGDAARLNELLVSAGVGVSELVQQQDSLMSLFYQITADKSQGAD